MVSHDSKQSLDEKDELDDIPKASANVSCGRPGGCCRESPTISSECSSGTDSSSSEGQTPPSETSPSAETEFRISTAPQIDSSLTGSSYALPIKSHEKMPKDTTHSIEAKSSSHLDAGPFKSAEGRPVNQFQPYLADGEFIFPPALHKYVAEPLCFGDDRKIWFRPTTLDQLLELKHAYPSAKLINGASEVQVEVRFKGSDFAVCIYVSDIEELKTASEHNRLSSNDVEMLRIGANTSLTEVEVMCRELYKKLGSRASAAEALRKQLRYFAGRQIRNTATYV